MLTTLSQPRRCTWSPLGPTGTRHRAPASRYPALRRWLLDRVPCDEVVHDGQVGRGAPAGTAASDPSREVARAHLYPGRTIRLDRHHLGSFGAVRAVSQLYGRALDELVPLLAWCPRFRLLAECVFDGRRLTVQLGSGDPIFPPSAPRPYDSCLEERFAREFRRLAPGWDLFREGAVAVPEHVGELVDHAPVPGRDDLAGLDARLDWRAKGVPAAGFMLRLTRLSALAAD